jgi:predicted aminopeptidase
MPNCCATKESITGSTGCNTKVKQRNFRRTDRWLDARFMMAFISRLPFSGLKSRFWLACLGLCLFACFSLFSGCSSVYLFQVALEEGKILWRRQPIERLLQNGELDSDTREKLRMVLAVREYARDTVNLRVGGSYASYSYVDRPVLSYILMATPKTELKPHTWWYPVVGAVPYKGFPSEDAANAEGAKFAAKDYDTYIRQAAAFSTLGWFDDPLMKHVLAYDKVTLAELIFHELLHNTLFVKGAVDFNESFANFVGYRAAIGFFQEKYGSSSAEYVKSVEAWEQQLEFARWLAELARELNELYDKDIPVEEKLRLREEIFAHSQARWAEQVALKPAHRYRGFSQAKLNNAVVAHYLLYLSHLHLFEALYVSLGKDLRQCVALVAEKVREAEDPFAAVQALVPEYRSGPTGASAQVPSTGRIATDG